MPGLKDIKMAEISSAGFLRFSMISPKFRCAKENRYATLDLPSKGVCAGILPTPTASAKRVAADRRARFSKDLQMGKAILLGLLSGLPCEGKKSGSDRIHATKSGPLCLKSHLRGFFSRMIFDIALIINWD